MAAAPLSVPHESEKRYKNNEQKYKTANYQLLKPNERDYFMRGIATYMAVENLENQIKNQDLYNLIERLFNKMPLLKTDEGMLKERIEKRRLTNEQGLKMIKDDVRQFGLLVQDFSAPNSFTFGHKSFMEFLFASTICDYINNKNPEVYIPILQVTDAQIKDLLKVPVSIDFVAELFGTSSTIQSSDTNDDDQIQAKYKTANRLLSAIIGHQKNIFLRLLLLNRGIRLTFRNKLLMKNILVICFNYISLFVVSMTFVVWGSYGYIISTYRDFDILTSLRYQSSFYMLFFVISFLIVYLFYYYLTVISIDRFLIRYNQEIRLWIKLCKKLEIDDFTLHKVVGTSRFSWSKDENLNNFENISRSQS